MPAGRRSCRSCWYRARACRLGGVRSYDGRPRMPAGGGLEWEPSGSAMPDQPLESRSGYAPLPSGHHGLPAERVTADQRARLNAAMVQLAAEAGYGRTTVEAVLSRAGVSRRTFYEHYDNKLDCFLAACDDVVRYWMRQGTLAYQRATPNDCEEDTVRVRLRIGLDALFGLVASDPLGARTIMLETLNCGREGIRRLEQAVADLEGIVERAFVTDGGPAELPSTMITVIVGGVLEIVGARLRHGTTSDLIDLADPLLEWMVVYRAPHAAAEVLLAQQALATIATATEEPNIDDRDEWRTADSDSPPLWRDESVRPIAVRDPRERIIDAAAQIAAERGYAGLSISEIDRAAGVSHHTFSRHFESSDEAFIEAYRAGSKETIAHSLRAYTAESTWSTAVYAGLAAELQFLARRPELARIGFLEVYAAGPQALELRETELQLFTAGLEPGYELRRGGKQPHRIVSEAIAGGIYLLIRERVLHDGPERLPALAADATYAALAPFIGPDEAAAAAVSCARA